MECCCGAVMSATIPDGARMIDNLWKKLTG